MRALLRAGGGKRRRGTPAPKKLLEGRYVTGGGTCSGCDVSPDDQRFPMIKAPGTEAGAAARAHRRATLGRGAEAARPDEARD
jgi:hypothetical protein